MENLLDEARSIINDVDAQMAALFEKRMQAVKMVYAYKKERGLPVLDQARENAVIAQNTKRIEDETLKDYYTEFIKNVMSVSREYQHHLQREAKVACCNGEGALVHVATGNTSTEGYDILIKRGILASAKQHLHLDRRVLIVTDTGVPAGYAEAIAAQCAQPVICTVAEGEASKSFDTLCQLHETMLEHGFSRKDCVVAVGGGVVGDLSGFAASTYMRGIDFYNIPTTLLSQIDSSIGGKTAINFGGVKNIVGTFYQPKCVLIDPELLRTLPERQISNGLAEAIKMALTSDAELFDILENKDIDANLNEIIIRSLQIKKSVVEQDEREAGLRKVLNFGHTIGHGIESSVDLSGLYHGECVAMGLIPMCDKSIQNRVIGVLQKCKLYNMIDFDWDAIEEAIFHDKKANGDLVTVTLVPEIGKFELKEMKCTDIIDLAKDCFKGEVQ